MTILPIYKNEEAKKKKDLICDINNRMGISNNEDLNDKLCLFFATEDGNNRHHKFYGRQGFYVNLGNDNGMIPSFYPKEIESILADLKEAKHFIWISRKTCESENINFAWVYSHELQHLKQSINNPYLLIAADLLDHIKRKIYYVPDLDFPTEFDCEKKAKEIVIKIFGEDECISYLKKMKTNSAGTADDNKRYDNLLELNTMVGFNIEEKIQEGICKNKKILKDIQKQIENNERVNWHIDIDKLCTCKDPHKAIMTSVTRIS